MRIKQENVYNVSRTGVQDIWYIKKYVSVITTTVIVALLLCSKSAFLLVTTRSLSLRQAKEKKLDL